MTISTAAIAVGVFAIALASCTPSQNGRSSPGEAFPPAANIDNQAQPPDTGAQTRADSLRNSPGGFGGPANRTGNPGYGYPLNPQPRPN